MCNLATAYSIYTSSEVYLLLQLMRVLLTKCITLAKDFHVASATCEKELPYATTTRQSQPMAIWDGWKILCIDTTQCGPAENGANQTWPELRWSSVEPLWWKLVSEPQNQSLSLLIQLEKKRKNEQKRKKKQIKIGSENYFVFSNDSRNEIRAGEWDESRISELSSGADTASRSFYLLPLHYSQGGMLWNWTIK